MCHKVLILLQINASQYVLILTPNNMGLFREKNIFERVGDGIRSRLLSTSIREELSILEVEMEAAKSLPTEERQVQTFQNLMKSIVILKQAKTRHQEAVEHKNDVFRLVKTDNLKIKV